MVSFREEQRFDWFWMPVTATPAAITGYGIYRQMWSARPVFDQPGVSILLWSAFAATLGVFVWFVGIKLVSEVRPEGMWIRFYWLRPERLIAWNEIERVEAVTYQPIRDFGGWGVRWAPRGIVYNTRGNRGVRIFLSNGKRVVLGSQRAEELARAITEHLDRAA